MRIVVSKISIGRKKVQTLRNLKPLAEQFLERTPLKPTLRGAIDFQLIRRNDSLLLLWFTTYMERPIRN